MAKWQDTFEQLKKRKKEMDQTSNTSERNQVNESYQPTVSRVQNSPTVSTRNFSALPTINTTSITNTILGINNNNTLPMYLPNITSNQFNAVKMPETTKTETNKTVKPTVETPTKTTQPVVNAEGYKETGKTYGDYWYQEYATRKDDKIYEKDGKYFLYDSKSGKYQDVDTVSYMTTKDDPSYKEAKKLGYKGSKSTLAHTSDKLKLDTSDLTKKEYKEYQSDLKRQQDKSDKELSRKSRINYGGAGLKGSLGVLKQYAQNLGDTVDDNVITPAKHIGDNYEVGKLNNELALEYYKKMEGKSNKVDKLEKKINTYNKFNQDLLEDPGALGTAIQQANTQVESIKNQGIAPTVLGTVGAGIGFAIGGPSGAVAGAKIGGGAGYTVGATPYTYKLEAGNQYQALTEMGVPDKVAKKYSKITGGINATIESGENLIDLATLGLTKLTGKGASTVSKQAVKEMVDDYGEDTVRKWLTDKIGEKATNTLLLAGKSYVQNIGSEALEESTQEATSIATERLATKEAGIKREATGKDDVERILDAGKTAAISTAFTAPLTSFGGSIATNTINRVEKKVNNKINNKAQNKTNTITDTELNNEIANEIENAMKNSNEKLTVEEVQQIQVQVQQQLIDDGIEISNTTTQETNSNLATEVESNTQYIDNNSNIWYNNNAEEGLYGNQQTNQNITNTTAYENQNELNRGTTNTENVEKNRINEGTVRSTTSSIRINEYKTDNGNIITYGETSPSKSFKDTYNIVKESKSSNPYGAFVDLHEESEYGKMKNFTLSDGSGNISITEDGNIVSVVKNPNSNIKGASKQLLLTALKNGGNKLDNYDGFLTDNYIKAGFEPVARVKFDPEYAPDGWNFERDGQPEFTQIDVECSFVDEDDVMNLGENLVASIFKEVKNIDLKLPLQRMKYDEAISKYGSDKPDLRFDMEINDITNIFNNTEFTIFKNIIEDGGVINAIVVKNVADKYSRKDLDKLTEYVKTYRATGLAYIKYNEEVTGSIVKIVSSEEINNLKEYLNIENNDLVLIISGKYNVVKTSLGALRCKLAKDLNLMNKNDYKLLWVVDFPSFEWSDEENRYMACHHPFTMPKDEDVDKLLTDKASCYSKAYDIVINGYEVGGGSIRIHDQNVQEKMFEALELTKEDINEKFGFFVDALKYGCPPHGGFALGLDRLTMLLAGTENIRDVIAFPKTASATDLMCECPTIVDNKQLNELGIVLDSQHN